MIKLNLSEVAEAVGGLLHGTDLTIQSVSTDSRAQENNELFIALKGEKYDAWDFLASAVKNGARAAVLSRAPEVDIPWVEVPDTTLALGRLGAYVKQKINPLTAGITGTCGKTTVKDMIFAIMSQVGTTLATAGNFNNNIGVPLTLLRLDESVRYAIVEMGTNHPGELEYSTSLVGEDVCLINNVGYAHLEGFKSLHGVFDAKYEIFSGLKNGGRAIFCADNEFAEEFLTRSEADGFRPLTFGSSPAAQVYPEDLTLLPEGGSRFILCTESIKLPISLHAPGRHNVLNACASAAVAFCLGASAEDVKAGLESYRPYEGRLKTEKHGHITLIDDTYNASANAVFAAIDVLESLPGRKIMILGDMGELGDYAQELHCKVGRRFSESSGDLLIGLGDLTRYTVAEAGDKGRFYEDRRELMDHLAGYIPDNEPAVILIKGSHGMRMGQILNFIRENLC